MRFRKVFSRVLVSLLTSVLFLIAGARASLGQATGSIVGSVSDPSAARMPGVTVTVTNRELGLERSAATSATGAYLFSSLQPGEYEITAELVGFKKTIKRATVNVGRDVTVDFTLEVGEVTQAIEVVGEASAINLVDSKVDAIVEQSQISDLPLNGRNAYEMAKLVPGVKVLNQTSSNADYLISIAGKASAATRYTVDGINVTDLTEGNVAINFSQEVVQEFQVSINNNDPSVGISSGGAVNIVTRSGSNALHGSFFGFFRNNQYAAFPGLSRPVLKPNPTNDPSIAAFNATQTDPPFWRRQFGGMLSGPLRKDRLFWSASVDVPKQVAAATFDTNNAELAAFNRIASYPRERLLQNYRLDWRATDKHSFFARFSRDVLSTRTSGASTQPATWTSLDRIRDNKAYVAMLAWTSVWSPSLVGDVRVGFTHVNIQALSVPESVQEAQLYAPLLPWMGDVTVTGTQMRFGNERNTPISALNVQPQIISNFTYMRGKHTWKFGGIFSPVRYWHAWHYSFPFETSVFNPTQARQAGIPVPSTFTTIGDLMQLPLGSLVFAVGKNYTYPFTFSGDGHNLLWSQQVHAYVGDSYKATPQLTLNWSVGWTYDAVAVPNRDLPRPKSIARLLDGGEVDPPHVKKDRFSPSVGFAWDPQGGGRTVIRGGFGVYWTTGAGRDGLRDRSLLAPVGDGYVQVPGTAITNPKTGTGTLSFGSAAANAAAGIFRVSDLVNYLSGIRNNLEQTLFTGTNRDFSVTNFDFFKGNASNAPIFDPNSREIYSLQSMLGVQRQLGNDWLLDATTIYNVANHTPFSLDANRFFRPLLTGGPALPGFGQIFIRHNAGKANYRALLLSARKRMTRRYQLGASYTLSSAKATAATLVNYDDFEDNFGYDAGNLRHVLNVNATVDLPWGFQVALLNEIQSKGPFNPFLSGIDLNGDGTADDRLPGVPLNGVNRSLSAGDVRKLAADFNQKYVGQRDARGTVIRPVNLPDKFRTGDSVITQDMRITKRISVGERFQVNLMAEVFNLLNIANLTFAASGGNVYGSGFGQPNGRLGNLFGSEGPRAFQFAARVTF